MFCTTAFCKSLAIRLFPLVKELAVLDNTEDALEREMRLWNISQDISYVVEQEEAQNPWPTAVTIATWAASESLGFKKSVDIGDQRGDSGRSWCIMQVHVPKGITPQGWSGKELVEDRTKCIKAGIDVMKWSYKVCKSNPEKLRLAAYASGRCDWAHSLTKGRWHRAKYLENKF